MSARGQPDELLWWVLLSLDLNVVALKRFWIVRPCYTPNVIVADLVFFALNLERRYSGHNILFWSIRYPSRKRFLPSFPVSPKIKGGEF
jgi:hypothetical protein